MRAYSMDLRARVFAALDAGDPTAVVADRFAVSRSWVRRLAQRRRENQEVGPGIPSPKNINRNRRNPLVSGGIR